VEGVGPTHLDGPSGRHQGLGCHLAAEHALPLLIGADAAEDVDLDWLEIEQVDQEVKGFTHLPILPGEKGAEGM
jgi:hypothetical protein